MPQQKQVSWAQLRVGGLVIVSLAFLAVAIFFMSGQVGFLSRRYTLKTYFSSASGLREGAEVRLAGIPVGNVRRIRISSFADDPTHAVEVDMRVATSYQDQIRDDSVATIETAGLLGEGFVDITRGARSQRPVPDSGVVKSKEEADIKQIVQNANDVISNLRVLSAKLNDVTGQIQSGQGTMGKFVYDQALYNRFNQTANAVQQMVDRVEKGQGSLGKLLSDDAFYQKTVATLDRFNKMLDTAEHGTGTIGRFMSDPTAYNNLNQAAGKANTLLDNINQGKGTLGKLSTDPTLYNHLNDTLARLDTIAGRIEKGEGTMGKLSTDATLYNNLSESAKTLREFLVDFRKDPKKYLTVHIRVF